MVHRSIIDSVDRAVAHLVEHHRGTFPAWLASVQVVVPPVSDAQEAATDQLLERCLSAQVVDTEA
ncbi:hypothetical protein ACIRRA_29860 [Nocardia sp. NPDC101769]|uniref:hypothetical protein n=1 Tax=Nocardia sp. NPDC101769 TaxID=3364333 RepID=UPI00381E816A